MPAVRPLRVVVWHAAPGAVGGLMLHPLLRPAVRSRHAGRVSRTGTGMLSSPDTGNPPIGRVILSTWYVRSLRTWCCAGEAVSHCPRRGPWRGGGGGGPRQRDATLDPLKGQLRAGSRPHRHLCTGTVECLGRERQRSSKAVTRNTVTQSYYTLYPVTPNTYTFAHVARHYNYEAQPS